MSINERIIKLTEILKVNQTQLAIICDVSKQAISAILKSETKPSLKVIENIVRKYPLLNSRWLLTGEGEVFTKGIYPEEKEIKQVNDSKSVYDCENCKRLNSYIEKQERLIEHLERQLGHVSPNKNIK